MQIIPWEPKAQRLSDVVSFWHMVSPSVMLTSNGELLSCIEFQPSDPSGVLPAQLVADRKSLNAALCAASATAGSRWAHYIECSCRETTEYEFAESYGEHISALVDMERARLFQTPGAQLTKRHVISIMYVPPTGLEGKLEAALEESDKKRRTPEYLSTRALETFDNAVASLRLDTERCSLDARVLAGDDLLTYLKSCVSTIDQPVRMPPIPLCLYGLFPDQDYTGGREPYLTDERGKTHIRTIVIRDTPDYTVPCIIDSLNYLRRPFRHVVRFIAVEREDARKILQGRIDALDAAKMPLMKRMISGVMRKEGEADPDFAKKIAQARHCFSELADGSAVYGYYTHSITLWDRDYDRLNDAVNLVLSDIRGRGFMATVPHAQLSHWVGSVPGHPHGGLTRLFKGSMSVADLAPFRGAWQGPKRDEHLNGPALLRCFTDSGTRFNLALHQPGSDVGDMAVIGQKGGGKSFLLSEMIAAHRKYHGSRVRIFDRGGTLKNAALVLGGVTHNLGARDCGVALQPLAFVHEESERAWAVEWLHMFMHQRGETLTSDQLNKLRAGLDIMAAMDVRHRTLTVLRGMVQDTRAKDALSVLCAGGAAGDLLDNSSHVHDLNADVIHYETDALIDRPIALTTVMSCIFHDIKRNYDGRPTLLVIDEAKTFVQHDIISAQLDEIWRRNRKERIQIIIATQNPLDIEHSKIAAIINDSCKQRIFTANSSALEKTTREAYGRIDLTEPQIEIIATMQPKSEYVYSTQGVFSKFRLDAGAVERSLFGRQEPKDRKEMDRLYAEHGPQEYPWAWLRYCGHADDEIAAMQRAVGYAPKESVQWASAAE